ncbi:MAG: hypothetical protein ABIH79_01510 [archaeon]
MKTSKIGELNFQKLKTEFNITPEIKSIFKKENISLSNLIPPAWLWYDYELLEVIDENGDGKPDERFGKEFKVIYYIDSKYNLELEKESILISKITIKNIKLKYAILKCQK